MKSNQKPAALQDNGPRGAPGEVDGSFGQGLLANTAIVSTTMKLSPETEPDLLEKW
ncbi:hypothetical protein [Candidatus Nitrospira nitrificans]|uniref:Uncharacterized protein n=1 Tax=Candidatus Nitrospira nitrificans TaxID=1742973 RepID=A0A0S4LD74_9BACT|nr:hypothetical protein [Candidatus Nitrospira nitrificans]CUS33851.1 hypothetical protein COMA2_140109 [Candidatus Nitrospira nitrificans]